MRFVSSLILGAVFGLIGPGAASFLPGSSLSSTFAFLVAAPFALPILGGLAYFGSSYLVEQEELLSTRRRAGRSGMVMIGLFLGLVGMLIVRFVLGGR